MHFFRRSVLLFLLVPALTAVQSACAQHGDGHHPTHDEHAQEAHADHAHTPLEGAWILTIAVPHGDPMISTVEASHADDQQTLMIIGRDGGQRALEKVSLVEGVLHFEIASGHGRIECDVHRQSETAFSGLCGGPQGEFATTLRRGATEKE